MFQVSRTTVAGRSGFSALHTTNQPKYLSAALLILIYNRKSLTHRRAILYIVQCTWYVLYSPRSESTRTTQRGASVGKCGKIPPRQNCSGSASALAHTYAACQTLLSNISTKSNSHTKYFTFQEVFEF